MKKLTAIQDANGNIVNISNMLSRIPQANRLFFSATRKTALSRLLTRTPIFIEYKYNANNELAMVINRNGDTTYFEYDAGHNFKKVKDSRGVTPIINEYNDSGRLIAHTDACGNRIEYAQDFTGKQEVITDRRGNITVYGYNDNGMVVLSLSVGIKKQGFEFCNHLKNNAL